MIHKIHPDTKCIKYVKCIGTGGWSGITEGKVYEVLKVIPRIDSIDSIENTYKYRILDDTLMPSVFYASRFIEDTGEHIHNLSKLKEI